MALESVDLLSLLKRARRPLESEAALLKAPVNQEAAVAVAESPEPPPRNPRPVIKLQEKEELDDLRAELYSDELLIQRILGLLYRCKKEKPNAGFISILDMERILNIEREGAAFVMSYMKTTKVIEMDDKSRMAITVPGIDYLRSVLGLRNATTDRAEPED
jgi:hypothetical protein